MASGGVVGAYGNWAWSEAGKTAEGVGELAQRVYNGEAGQIANEMLMHIRGQAVNVLSTHGDTFQKLAEGDYEGALDEHLDGAGDAWELAAMGLGAGMGGKLFLKAIKLNKLAGKLARNSACSLAVGTVLMTSMGLTPVEDLQIGERVATESGLDSEPIDADDYRVVTAEFAGGNGDVLQMKVLRAAEWLELHRVATGSLLPLHDLGFPDAGSAEVLSVDFAPAIADGPGRLVTGTFTHVAKNLLELSIGDADATLIVTPNHLLRSADRDDWVPANQLAIGEQLVTPDGPVPLRAREVVHGAEPVYDIEVEGEHAYLATELGVDGHYCPPGSGKKVGQAAETRAEHIEAGIPESALGPSGKPKIHVKAHSTRKRAQDTAQSRSRRGGAATEHSNPTNGDPHFHPDGSNAREHHTYPKK